MGWVISASGWTRLDYLPRRHMAPLSWSPQSCAHNRTDPYILRHRHFSVNPHIPFLSFLFLAQDFLFEYVRFLYEVKQFVWQ
jgi:hypothetical protein